MDNLQKLINLAKNEGGKVFIVNQLGEPQAVVMSFEEYSKMKSNPGYAQLYERIERLTKQAEELNQAVTKVQMEESEPEEVEAADQPSAESFYIEPIEET